MLSAEDVPEAAQVRNYLPSNHRQTIALIRLWLARFQYTAVGNAVAPPIITVIGRALVSAL